MNKRRRFKAKRRRAIAVVRSNPELKLIAHARYVMARCEGIGFADLCVMLWQSDMRAYGQRGRAMTGVPYVKHELGAVPKCWVPHADKLLAMVKP